MYLKLPIQGGAPNNGPFETLKLDSYKAQHQKIQLKIKVENLNLQSRKNNFEIFERQNPSRSQLYDFHFFLSSSVSGLT